MTFALLLVIVAFVAGYRAGTGNGVREAQLRAAASREFLMQLGSPLNLRLCQATNVWEAE